MLSHRLDQLVGQTKVVEELYFIRRESVRDRRGVDVRGHGFVIGARFCHFDQILEPLGGGGRARRHQRNEHGHTGSDQQTYHGALPVQGSADCFGFAMGYPWGAHGWKLNTTFILSGRLVHYRSYPIK
jgi:hypothetical protein